MRTTPVPATFLMIALMTVLPACGGSSDPDDIGAGPDDIERASEELEALSSAFDSLSATASVALPTFGSAEYVGRAGLAVEFADGEQAAVVSKADFVVDFEDATVNGQLTEFIGGVAGSIAGTLSIAGTIDTSTPEALLSGALSGSVIATGNEGDSQTYTVVAGVAGGFKGESAEMIGGAAVGTISDGERVGSLIGAFIAER